MKIIIVRIALICIALLVWASISNAQMLWHIPDTNGWSIQNVAISANGNVCIVNTGKDYRSFRVIDGMPIQTYGVIQGPGVAISPDASMVAIPADSGVIKIEDTYNGNELFELRLPNASDSLIVQSIDWSRDGKYIVAAYSDTIVRLWSVASHDTVWTNSATSLAWPSYDTLSTLVVDFSPSTQFIAVKRYGASTIIIWSLAGEQVKYVDFATAYGALPFAPDGHHYWIADAHEYDVLDSSYEKIASSDVAFGPISYASSNRVIYIWGPWATWVGIDQFPSPYFVGQYIADTLMSTLAVSGGYRYALTGSRLGALMMWDISAYSGSSRVNFGASSPLSLRAFEDNSRITAAIPNGEDGRIFVYRTDGVCYFTSDVRAGESLVTTGALPFGDYFVIFQSEKAARFFTKVSIFK